MTTSVQIIRGIENLFGTRDENIRLFETGLNVKTHLVANSLEIQGEPENVSRAETFLLDYVSLVQRRDSAFERRTSQLCERLH